MSHSEGSDNSLPSIYFVFGEVEDTGGVIGHTPALRRTGTCVCPISVLSELILINTFFNPKLTFNEGRIGRDGTLPLSVRSSW